MKSIIKIMEAEHEKLDRNFEKIKTEAEIYYASVNEVFCPYFNETIAFNRKGITHIKFKKDTIARSRADQFMRLKHIKYAFRILEKSRTLQEYKVSKSFEEVKDKNGKEKVLQEVTYYGFIAIIQDSAGMKRLKIVVKQVAGGKKYFWSIIPYWSSNKELKLHSGDIEED